MNELTVLFSQHSLEELIVIIAGVCLAVQAIWKIATFFYDKAREHFGMETRQSNWEDDTTKTLRNIQAQISELREQNKQMAHQQEGIEQIVAATQERLQQDTRSYLIEAHHRFVREYGEIDELSLDTIERRYLYYKTAGGDTFVGNLMEEIRALPRVYYGTNNQRQRTDGRDEK